MNQKSLDIQVDACSHVCSSLLCAWIAWMACENGGSDGKMSIGSTILRTEVSGSAVSLGSAVFCLGAIIIAATLGWTDGDFRWGFMHVVGDLEDG